MSDQAKPIPTGEPALRCPVCASPAFLEFNGRANARCANCRTMERTRLLWMVLGRFELFRPGLRVLHFAPELAFAKRFAQLSGEGYHACDIDPDRYKSSFTTLRPLDLCKDLVKLPSRSFDLIIHSHVLEHVSCAVEGVLHELERILAPGGHHFFSVPVRGDTTQEDLSDQLTPQHRLLLFGQDDHMRIFGKKSLAEMLDRTWGVSGAHAIEPLKMFSEAALRQAAIPEAAWTDVSSHSIFHHQKPRYTKIARTPRRAADAVTALPSINRTQGPSVGHQETVIFHIGTPKTGTTAIQRWLTANRAEALRCGLDYWAAAENHSELAFHAFASARRANLDQMWFQRGQEQLDKASALAKFKEFLAGLEGRLGFVSAEAMWTFTRPEIAAFRAQLEELGASAEFICWVRSPEHYFASAFQQKARGGLTFSELGLRPDRLIPMSYARLDNWLEEFGQDRVHVRLYQRDMLSDLRTALGGFGVRLPAAALGAAPANESISLTAAKAFMALGDEQRRRQDGGAPPKIASLLQAALMKLPGSPFAVPEYTARAMQGVFAKERAYLNERFGIATEADTGIECVDERQFYGFDAEEVGRLLRAINDLLVARDKPAGPGSTS